MGRCLRLRISGLSGGSATTLRGVRADRSPSSRPIFHQREGSSLNPTGGDFNSGNYGASSPSLTCLFMDGYLFSDISPQGSERCSNALQDPCCAWTGIDPPPVSAWFGSLLGFVPPQGVGMDGMGWYGRRCTGEVCVASL
jgi:hypothetical protein